MFWMFCEGDEIFRSTLGGLTLQFLRPPAGATAQRVYLLLLLEVQQVGRGHLHAWRGAPGPSLPGARLQAHASVLTGWSAAARLAPRFLHHDLKILGWGRREREREKRDRSGEKQLLKQAAIRSHFNSGPSLNICQILPTQSRRYCMFPCWLQLVCLLAGKCSERAHTHSHTHSQQALVGDFFFFPVWIP